MAACFVGYGAGGYTFLPSSRLSSSRRSFARKRAIEDGANLSTDTDRNAKGAVRGTYYWKQEDSAQPVTVTFDTASGEVVGECALDFLRRRPQSHSVSQNAIDSFSVQGHQPV
ncbi:hypothetical protein BSKO_04582 [Bryopsis sp. KO-2023]|nr:hypothetical protein BSKO_04582 [Bryopsis sp. KO-2023]